MMPDDNNKKDKGLLQPKEQLLKEKFLYKVDKINANVLKTISCPDLQVGLKDFAFPPRALILPSKDAPEDTQDKLYNENGTLKFDGSSLGGGGGAPTDAQYVTLATDVGLSAERVLTAGSGISITDGGAGGNVTIASQAYPSPWVDGGHKIKTTGSVAISGGENIYADAAGSDTFFYVSGAIGSRDVTTGDASSGAAVFGGDVVASGALYVSTAENISLLSTGDDGTNDAMIMIQSDKDSTNSADTAIEIKSENGILQFTNEGLDIDVGVRGVTIDIQGTVSTNPTFFVRSQDSEVAGSIELQSDDGGIMLEADGQIKLFSNGFDSTGGGAGGNPKAIWLDTTPAGVLGGGITIEAALNYGLNITSSFVHIADRSLKESAGVVPSSPGTDTFFFVSGSTTSKDPSDKGTAVFGGNTVVSGGLIVSAPGEGQDVTFHGEDADAIGLQWDADATEHGKLTLGQDDHGVDLQVYGETSGKYLRWDQSADTFYLWGSLNTRYDQVFDGSSQGWDFTVNTNSRVGIYVSGNPDQVYILSGGTGTGGTSPDPANASDLAFFVSGTVGSRGTSTKGTAVFGGDVVISGSLSTVGAMASAKYTDKLYYYTTRDTLQYLSWWGPGGESTQLRTTGEEYAQFWIAPFDGALETVIIRCQSDPANTEPGSTVIGFHKNANTTATETETVTISSWNTNYTATFSDATFSKGDALTISVDPTNPPRYGILRFVFRLDEST